MIGAVMILLLAGFGRRQVLAALMRLRCCVYIYTRSAGCRTGLSYYETFQTRRSVALLKRASGSTLVFASNSAQHISSHRSFILLYDGDAWCVGQLDAASIKQKCYLAWCSAQLSSLPRKTIMLSGAINETRVTVTLFCLCKCATITHTNENEYNQAPAQQEKS